MGMATRFRVGQTWEYATRAGEEASRLVVLRVDDVGETGHAGVIVHAAVEGVWLAGEPGAIGFLPIAEASLEASVTRMEGEDPCFTPSADFADGYAGWRRAFDEGKAGFWTAPVARVIQTVDDGMSRG